MHLLQQLVRTPGLSCNVPQRPTPSVIPSLTLNNNIYNITTQQLLLLLQYPPTLTVGSSLLSLQFVSHSPLVQLASILTLLLGPIVALQARTLHQGGIRIITNELRQEINYCQLEQERLHRSLLRLDDTMDQLQAMEREISRYSKDPVLLRKLVRLVQEQTLVHQRMNKAIQQQIIQTIMKGVTLSDRDKDGHIGPTEIDALILQLQQLPGISLNEIKFREKMTTQGQSLQTVMHMMRHLDDSDVFHMTTKKLILPQKSL